jgi:hypothetical protein
MGAQIFTDRSHGRDAREAFSICKRLALKEAAGKSTGTIAEKEDFVRIKDVEGVNLEEADNYARRLLNREDKRVSDRKGPAGCIKIDTGEYFFFGWAGA